MVPLLLHPGTAPAHGGLQQLEPDTGSRRVPACARSGNLLMMQRRRQLASLSLAFSLAFAASAFAAAASEQGSADDTITTGSLPSSTADEPVPVPPAKPSAQIAKPSAPTAKPSAEELCNVMAAAAQEHGIPITFFSNLIWQESRFVLTDVSHAGALGIAQFMPGTAATVGLKDPFDPFEALPASARLLGKLYQKFGNLGLAAAAY